ncbi:MAG: PorT family protein [Bacteroidales bacterium]|nr:PorT family protein [Bacteroidales bacterium]
MKRLIIAGITILLLKPFTVKSQELAIGFSPGLNISMIRETDKLESYSREFKPILTYNLSALIAYEGRSFWGISAEPGYIQKGALIRYADDDYKKKLHCINIPVYFDIYFGKRLNLSVGPELSYIVKVDFKSDNSSTDFTELYERRYELSGNIGFFYNVIKQIDIGIRYSHGLTRFFKIFLWFVSFHHWKRNERNICLKELPKHNNIKLSILE